MCEVKTRNILYYVSGETGRAAVAAATGGGDSGRLVAEAVAAVAVISDGGRHYVQGGDG